MIATQMAVIHQGKLCIEGSVQDLLKQGQSAVLVKTDRSAEALQFLKSNDCYSTAKTHSDGIIIELDQQHIPELNRQLVDAGFDVHALVPKRSLETYFLNLIEGHETQ